MSVSSSLTTVFQICKSDFPLFAVLELVTTSVNQPSLGLTLSKWLYYCLLIASLEQELPCQDYSLAIASLAYLDSWHKNAHLRGAPLVFLFGDAIISWGCLWSFTSSVTGRVQPQNEKVLLPVIRYPKKRKGSIYPNLHLFFFHFWLQHSPREGTEESQGAVEKRWGFNFRSILQLHQQDTGPVFFPARCGGDGKGKHERQTTKNATYWHIVRDQC